MAEKGPPISNPDKMTPDEIQKLVETLSAMKIKPKADSPSDLLHWMASIVDVGKETGAIPKTPTGPKPELSTPTSPASIVKENCDSMIAFRSKTIKFNHSPL